MEEVKNSPVEEDMDFFKREWYLERSSWVFMFFFVTLAALGLMGDGIISKASIGNENDKIKVQYSSLMRLLTPDKFTVFLSANDSEQQVVWIDRNYLKDIEIENIIPYPESQTVLEDKVNFNFKSSPSSKNLEITFTIKANEFGFYRPKIGTGEEYKEFKQFVYL